MALRWSDVKDEVRLVQIVLQPAEADTPLRMWALDGMGRLWTRVKGSAGWGEWARDHGPFRDWQ